MKNHMYALLMLLLCLPARAVVTLPSFFTDNMVLQQKREVPFFGSSDAPVVIVTTSWDNRSYKATVKNKQWRVLLKTPVYGGPYTISINDNAQLRLKNVMIGEVWLCSGQSNMEMPLAGWGRVHNFEQEISEANYPDIRLLQAAHAYSSTPADNLKIEGNGWQACSPQAVAGFSSTAYFFARKLYNELHIPIGLIHSSWGGTVIEAWTSYNALRTVHDFDRELSMLNDQEKFDAAKTSYEEAVKAWNAHLLIDETKAQGAANAWAAADFNDKGWKLHQLPGFWENSVLPEFDGVVWYRRKFTVPPSMAGKTLTLHFLADDDDIVWVNGKQVGSTKGYNVQREYIISPELLIAGENSIAIRVFDGGGGGGIYGQPDDLVLSSNDNSLPLSGGWKYAVAANMKNLPPQPGFPQGQNRPTVLYNAMIHPLLSVQLAGVIWYQGESNAARAHQYQTLFPLMINDWRKEFAQPDLPFYFVQLANYTLPKPEPGESDWAELREAQLMALALPHTGMAVAIDIGEAQDIHPKNKQEVGERLGRIALAKNYKKGIAYSGPVFKSAATTGSAVAITFGFSEGLGPQSGTTLKGFAIAGEDRVFYRAEAKVTGGTVIVSSPKVAKPVSVRYNWASNPDGNLINSSGLPASPFRTDKWPGITFNRK